MEGPDDEHVVAHLCTQSRLARNFEIDQKGGFSEPRPAIKAQVHAWLAARAAARPMGSAIGTGHLDASTPPATSFISWLQRLFHDSAASTVEVTLGRSSRLSASRLVT